MQDNFFLTTKRPRHDYKTQKIRRTLRRGVRRTGFGPRAFFSNFKKYLYCKNVFTWLFRLPRQNQRRYFSALLRKLPKLRALNMRTLGLVYFFMEHNLVAVLVRSRFCSTVNEALVQCRLGSVQLDGQTVTQPLRTVTFGSLLELSVKLTKFYIFCWLSLFVLPHYYSWRALAFQLPLRGVVLRRRSRRLSRRLRPLNVSWLDQGFQIT